MRPPGIRIDERRDGRETTLILLQGAPVASWSRSPAGTWIGRDAHGTLVQLRALALTRSLARTELVRAVIEFEQDLLATFDRIFQDPVPRQPSPHAMNPGQAAARPRSHHS